MVFFVSGVSALDFIDNDSTNFSPSSDVISVAIPIGLYDIRNTEDGQEIFIENFVEDLFF